MRKAEGEALQRRIVELEKQNKILRSNECILRGIVQSQRESICRARSLLGRWMHERFDRERYPVAATRRFLKW